MTEFEKAIYISHRFQGKDSNAEDAERIIKLLQKEYPSYLFISPIHTFRFLYNEVDYNTGLDMCLWLLEKCDECWVVGNNWESSIGVKAEIEYCKGHGIPHKIVGDVK